VLAEVLIVEVVGVPHELKGRLAGLIPGRKAPRPVLKFMAAPGNRITAG